MESERRYRLPAKRGVDHLHAEISPDAKLTPQNSLNQRQHNILKLQQSHGNAAVCRMLDRVQRAGYSAGAPRQGQTLSEDVITSMKTDVEKIVDILRSAYINEVEEETIVLIVERWANYDEDTDGEPGPPAATPALDKFLFLLKTRAYTHSNIRSAWVEQTSMTFDDLWHRLSDDHLARFKAAQAKSKRQAATGPDSAQNENFWKTLGKQEAMGLFATLGGITQGAAGIVDAGAWAITKAMKAAGLPVADPASAAQWVADQYKFSGDQMFGQEYSKGEKLVGGMNASEIGNAGGNLIWTLVSVQSGAAKAMTAFNIASALKGVNDAAENIAKIVAEKQTKGKFAASELLTDPNFLTECSKLAVSIFGAVSAGSSTNSNMADAAAKSMQRIGLLLNTMQATAQFGQLVDIAMSDKSPAEKSAAAGQVVVALLNTGASMLPANPNMHWTEIGGGQNQKTTGGEAHPASEPATADVGQNQKTEETGAGGGEEGPAAESTDQSTNQKTEETGAGGGEEGPAAESTDQSTNQKTEETGAGGGEAGPEEQPVRDPNAFEFDESSPSGLKPLGAAEVPIPAEPGADQPASGLKLIDETEPTDKTTTGAGGRGGSRNANPPNVPPPGTEFARGHDPAIIHSVYIDAARKNGNSGVEVGVFSRPDPAGKGPDEYVVVQGRVGAVSPPDESWTAVSHFHPDADTQPGFHNPAPQDFLGPSRSFAKNPTSEQVESVHSFLPDGSVTEVKFGVDPNAPGGSSYFVEIPGQKRMYFTDMYPDSADAAVNNANAIRNPDARLKALLAEFRKLPKTSYARWWADQFVGI